MEQIRLNEQIILLRKKKGITQEELARALGVTNQAVSKWESAQCCPDIQLLPEIAAFFGVSIDQLMGYRGADTSDDLLLQLRTAMDHAQTGEDERLALRLAYTIHATLLSKEEQSAEPGWNSDDAIEHAGKGEWGMSSVSHPNMTTRMHYGSVFFSDNALHLDRGDRLAALCNCMRSLCTAAAMKTFVAVFALTIHDQSKYVSVAEIAKYAGLSEGAVSRQLENNLVGYLRTQNRAGILCYRIDGRWMHMLPLLAMICDP